jgi:hypothetical protein
MHCHSGFKLQCTKVAETLTESSPIQQGEEGGFYLILAGSRMLRGEKVMSQDFFATKIGRENATNTSSSRIAT